MAKKKVSAKRSAAPRKKASGLHLPMVMIVTVSVIALAVGITFLSGAFTPKSESVLSAKNSAPKFSSHNSTASKAIDAIINDANADSQDDNTVINDTSDESTVNDSINDVSSINNVAPDTE